MRIILKMRKCVLGVESTANVRETKFLEAIRNRQQVIGEVGRW